MTDDALLKVPHVIRGEVRTASAVEHCTRIGHQFATPRIELDELVVPRTEPGPAFETPIAEVLDFLAKTGRALDLERNPFLYEAAELMTRVSPQSRRVIENCYRGLGSMFDPDALGYQVERELGVAASDGWTPVYRPGAPRCHVRAFPPRLVHVMPGNGPAAAAMTIARGALTKGINLLKLPSNDLYTASAILRTMAAIDPDHPTVRSFSAVYWRGGDVETEGVIFRPQYFDKLVAWGGADTIRHATRYLGPGFELVAFDPKVSISLIGRQAFSDDRTLARVAGLAASDATPMNQEGCVASRFQFVEGETGQVDRYCELLARELAVDRDWSDGRGWKTPAEIRDQVEVLTCTDEFRGWGDYEGSGLVIRSQDPVDFHPTAKTVNVVPVRDLSDATAHATVATQTVGVFPASRKAGVRDALACAGVQRVVTLGTAMGLASAGHGLPHDGSYPLQRLMRWVSDEDIADGLDVGGADGLELDYGQRAAA